MATNQRVNVTLGFTADTSQAKQSILDLQSALSKIASTNIMGDDTQSLQSASEAAKELSLHLTNAYNANTGKLDLSKFNKSLESSKTNLTDLSMRLTSIGPEGQKAFVQLAQSIAAAERPVISLNSKISNMVQTLNNTIRWQVASSMIHQVQGAVQTAVGYAEDLNKSLNNIRIVSGQSVDQMAKFAEQANKAAKALSSTTLDYTDAALIYYQQGLSDEEVLARTDVTIKMANVAGESAQTVSDQLTAVWNNFYDGSKSLEYYADVMTKLGAATASSTDEIAEGLEKFAAIADTVGLSYEYATAALATVTSNTRQSADVVGTAFKTIFARMQDLELGNTLDDGTTLGTYSQAMKKVGISVLDTNGNLIAMDDILDSMAAKWETLSKAQQVSLAQSVAGVRQYNQLISLMDNWNKTDADSMISNLGYVENAEGTLKEQADIFEESWEAAANRVQASMEALYSDIIDDKFFIKLLDFLSEGIDSVDALIDGMGGIKPILVGLVGYFMSAISTKIEPAIRSIRENLEIVFTGKSSSAQRAAEESDKAFNKILLTSGLNEKDRYELEAARELNKVKAKYNSIAHELTDEEKSRYELEIAILSIHQQEVRDLQKEQDTLAETIKKREKAVETANNKFDAEKKAHQLATQNLKTAKETLKNDEEAVKAANAKVQALKQSSVRNNFNEAKKHTNIGNRTESLQDKVRNSSSGSEKRQNLSEYKNYQNQAAELEVQFKNFYDKLILEYEAAMEKTSGDLSKLGVNDLTSVSLSNDKLNGYVEELTKISQISGTGSFQKISEGVNGLRIQIEEATYGLINFDEEFDAIEMAAAGSNRQNLDKAISALVEKIKNAEIGAEEFEAILKKLGQKDYISSLCEHYKEIALAEKEAAKAAEEVAKAQEKVRKAKESLNKQGATTGDARKALGEAEKELREAQDKQEEVEVKEKKLRKSDSKVVEDFDPKHKIESGTEILTKFAAGASQAVMAINSFNSAWQALNNEDLSFLETAITVISSLSIAIPTLVSAYDNLTKAMTAWAFTSKFATELMQKENELTATQIVLKSILKVVQDALKGGLITTVALYIALAAAIAGIVAIVKKLIKVWEEWKATTPEGQLKAAREEATRLAEELENAKNAAEELKSSFSSYETIQETLNKAAKGTAEWNEALKENNETVLELLRLYPQLANAYTIDKNGILKLDTNAWQQEIQNYTNATNAKNLLIAANSLKINEDEIAVEAEEIIKNRDLSVQAEGWQRGIIAKYGYNYTDEQIEKYAKELSKNYEGESYNSNIRNIKEVVGNSYTREALSKLGEKETEIKQNAVKSGQATVVTVLSGQEGISNDVLSLIDFNPEELNELAAEKTNDELFEAWKEANPSIANNAKFQGDIQEDGSIRYTIDDWNTIETIDAEDVAKDSVGLEYLEQLIQQGKNFTTATKGFSSDEMAILKSVKSNSVSGLTLDQLKNAEEIWAGIVDQAETLGITLDSQHFSWEDARDKFDYEAYWKNQANAAKTYAEDANEIASTLSAGDDLDEDQEAKLNTLISKYSYLNDLKEKGGHEYLQALRDIGQTEEQNYLEALQHTETELKKKKAQLQLAYASAMRSGDTEMAEDLKSKLEKVMDEITNNDYSIKVAIQADLESDISSALDLSSEYEKISDYLTDGLNISVEKAKQIMEDGNGAMLTNCKMTTDGMIQLDQSVIDSFVAGKKEEFEAAKIAEINKLKAKRDNYESALQILQNEYETFCGNEENMTDIAKLEAIEQMAMKQAEANDKVNSIDEVTAANAKGGQSTITIGDQVAQAWVDYLNEIGNAANATNLAIANIGNGDYTFEETKHRQTSHRLHVYQTEEERNFAIGEEGSGITKENSIALNGTKIGEVTLTALEEYMDQTTGSVSEAIDALYNASKKSYEDRIESLSNDIGSIDLGIAALESAEFNLDNVSGSLSEILERYHEINREIQRQERLLEQLSKEKDKAFGSDKLEYIDQEIKSYKSLISLQNDLIKAAKDFLEIDKEKVQTLFGGQANINFETGEISNYTELYRYATDEQREALEQYEETLDALHDAEDQVEEYKNNILDANYEALELKLELKLNIDDAKIQELEFLLTQYGDNFYKRAEAAVAMIDKVPVYEDLLKVYENHQEELNQKYKDSKISQADYIEGLKGVRDGYYEQLEALIALDEEMMTYYEDTLSAATAELEDYTDHMEHLTSVFEHYTNLMEILGKQKDYDAMGDFLSGNAETLRDRLDVAKQYYQILQDQRIEAEKALALADDEEEREQLKKSLDAIIDEVDAAEDEVLSLTEEWAEAMKAVIENEMASIADTLEKALTKGLGFDSLMDSFDKLNTRQEEYLTKTNQIYETNKLMRTASKALDETDNKVSKQKLQNFIDETESLQEQTQLSEYELEIQQAKYDLLLAEIALEEAQNAKSTVRLSRDSEGNFGYVYTADQDAIDDAQQGVDDAQNRLYNLSLEGQQDYTDKYLQAQQAMYEELTELQQQYLDGEITSEEEYERLKEEILFHYYDPDSGILTTYSKLYNVAVRTDADATADYWAKDYGAMTQNTAEWKDAVYDYLEEIKVQTDSWKQVSVDANEDVENALENSRKKTEELTTESEELKEMLEDEVLDAIEDEIDAVRIQTEAYAEQREELQGLINKYKEYISLLNSQIAEASGGDKMATDYSTEMVNAYLSGDWNAVRSWAVDREHKESLGNYTSVTTDRLMNLFTKAKAGDSKAEQLINEVASGKKYFTDAALSEYGFDTGGYTGAWGPEGRLAFLHEKELVLNQDDTNNLLKTVSFIRELVSTIDSQASLAGLFNLTSTGIGSSGQTLEQNVHIEASFPNATNHSEIEEAFTNLVNRASQYANRK